jgi:hypothetical protein
MLQEFGSVATGPETKVDSKALTTAICRYRNQGVVHYGLFALDTCCNENIFAPVSASVDVGSDGCRVQVYSGQSIMLGPRASLELVNANGAGVVING